MNTEVTSSMCVGLFFVVKGKLFAHICSIEKAEASGDFLNYPKSHDEVWQDKYYTIYQVDFDYFPRGRVVYNRREEKFILYVDHCLEHHEINEIIDHFKLSTKNYETLFDEHYQCRRCNLNYNM